MVAYVGLGTNLGCRQSNLQAGIEGLRRSGLEPLALSSIWETEPVDTRHPQWFWNMAAGIRGPDDPWELLDILQAVERDAGRLRGERNAPRTLDLDLLLMGDLRIEAPRLRLPHPRMWQRRFVLAPLAEIAPDLRNPESGRTVSQECSRLGDRETVRRLAVASCYNRAFLQERGTS